MSQPNANDMNEIDRLAALRSYRVLDTDPERDFDDIVRLAQRIFAVPIAFISFMDDQQFLKARVGVDACRISRRGSFCNQTILADECLVVLDTAADPRFATSPYVIGEPYGRFYGGVPLINADGFAIGTLCVIDRTPRAVFDQHQRETLTALACLVMERLEARKAKLRERDSRRQFEAIAATSVDAIICADGHNRIISWNKAAECIFGFTATEAVGQPLTIIVPPALRAMHNAGIERVIAGGAFKLIGSVVTVPACRRDGSEFPIELSLSHWREGNEHRFGAIARDITDRQEKERRLKREADFDHLTDISNRKVLMERMQGAIRDGRSATLLLLDIDGFKDVNDSLGHAAGDEVLKVVARRLVAECDGTGLVSRLGGDEFTFLLERAADPLAAIDQGRRLVAAIEQPIEVQKRSIYIGASVGVAVAGHDDWDADDLLADADLALYRAKAEGKNRVRLFTPDLRSVVETRTSVSSNVREAWERQEFEMYYQPQILFRDGTLAGAEALIRWNQLGRGVVSPAAFLPTVETSLLAVPVSEWILRTSCEQASRWRKLGLKSFRIGINLFAAQFRAGDLPDVVARALADFDLPPEALELEVTENIILRSSDGIHKDLAALRAMGVGLAFDDYGTGYASLTMLKDYPVTKLKIDRSFVSGIAQSRHDQTIVAAITKLAEGFDLEVIAEGIETRAQADFMRSYCVEGQGYFYGRPMPAQQFERMFAPRSATLKIAG